MSGWFGLLSWQVAAAGCDVECSNSWWDWPRCEASMQVSCSGALFCFDGECGSIDGYAQCMSVDFPWWHATLDCGIMPPFRRGPSGGDPWALFDGQRIWSQGAASALASSSTADAEALVERLEAGARGARPVAERIFVVGNDGAPKHRTLLVWSGDGLPAPTVGGRPVVGEFVGRLAGSAGHLDGELLFATAALGHDEVLGLVADHVEVTGPAGHEVPFVILFHLGIGADGVQQIALHHYAPGERGEAVGSCAP